MYTFEQLEEKYKALPLDIRRAMDSVDMAKALQGLGEKYKLHLDKIDELSDETSMVMLGITHPKNYLGNLKRRLEIPEDMARDLVEEINREIFLPIRESLKKIHRIERDDDFKPTPAVEAAVVTSEDRKIFAENGIEIQPTRQDFAEQNLDGQAMAEKSIPEGNEVLAALENSKDMPKEEQLLSAGFTTVIKSALPSSGEIAAPDKKLETQIKMPVSESVYSPDGGNGDKPAFPQKYSIDPYREPIA